MNKAISIDKNICNPTFFDDDGKPTNIKIFDISDQYAKMAEWDDTYIESRMWDLMHAVEDPIEEAILLIKEWVKGEPGYKLADWKEGVWPFNGYAIEGYVKYEDIEGAIRADMKTYIGYCDDRLDFQDILVSWAKETMKVELIYTNANGSIEYHKEFYIKGTAER